MQPKMSVNRTRCGQGLLPPIAGYLYPRLHKNDFCHLAIQVIAFSGRKMTLHRPHPGKEALRYRVLATREFIERMGIKP